MNEILDDPDYDGNNIGTVDKLVIRNSLMATVIFIGVYYLRGILPENLVDWEGAELKTYGMIVFMVMFITVRFTVDSIYKTDETKKAVAIGILGGSVVFYSYTSFLLILNSLIFGNGIDIDLIAILKGAVVISLFGFFYGYTRAAKIKGEKRTIPILLFVGFFLLFGTLAKNGILN